MKLFSLLKISNKYKILKFEYLKYLSASGDIDAQVELAKKYILGEDIEKDLQQGKFYLQLAIIKVIHNPFNLRKIWNTYYILRDFELAIKYLKKCEDCRMIRKINIIYFFFF